MSRSLRRVTAALAAAGLEATPREMGETRTAQQAAEAVGCALDRIVKSMVFAFEDDPSAGAALFLTAGGNDVDATKASALAGRSLGRADGAFVRAVTGFAIGGVAPVGHLTRPEVWMDARLMEFDVVWAAAGTPRHVFPIAPSDLRRVNGAVIADFS
jgi:prolyl-tRNA editing enzyme YbaK/EbsC (Cys-tRNA(Pro) deacylase)